jgi:hypothetical protein
MKLGKSGDTKSLFIEPYEIGHVRIDDKKNIVILFRNPTKDNDNKSIFGFRSKLAGDPTGTYPDEEFQISPMNKGQADDEEMIANEGVQLEQEN